MAFQHFSLPILDECFSKAALKETVIVVSIIGKTTVRNVPYRSNKIPFGIDSIEELIDRIDAEDKQYTRHCDIEAYYDDKEKVVYLTLNGPMNTHKLMSILRTSKEEIDNKGFLNFWCDVRNSYARSLLFMFSFSHIVVMSNPGYSLNLSVIQLLKVLNYVRPKYQAAVSKALATCREISEDWSYYGRLCSPRLLFLFNDCPYEISSDRNKSERIARIKKLGHSIEDQIYMALRKSRLVKHACNRAFFSIAPNDEFVFVKIDKRKYEDPDLMVENYMDKYLDESLAEQMNLLAISPGSSGFYSEDSLSPTETESSELGDFESFATEGDYMNPSSSHDGYGSSNDSSDNDDTMDEDNILNYFKGPKVPKHSFTEFLMKHIRKAHKEGFRDNMGKYSNVKPYFERPRLHSWIAAVNTVLADTEAGLDSPNSTSAQLEKLLGTELQFSTARCKKVLPLALAVYQENLPSNYDKITHEKKVKQAVAVFIHHARGPAQQKFIGHLKDECEKIWKSGRQTCEALSLNRNTCTKPKHLTSTTGLLQIGESEHWSGIQFYSSCNCGAKQGPRQDPFTLRSANHDFYQIIAQECGCIHFDRYNFPVFQPSSADYREADINNPPAVDGSSHHVSEVQSDVQLCSQSSSTEKPWNHQDSVHESDGAMSIPLSTLYFEHGDNLAMNYYSSNHHEKHLTRQASTTEYLPGLIHLESPFGLLPLFPSWSLLCRGPSSLYSHNLGLHDLPGFIPGSAYLLPWDVSFRERDLLKPDSDASKKPSPSSPFQILKHSNRRNQRPVKEFVNLKIFIGIEYECVRGHRFMSSAPGVVLKAMGTSVKDDAHKITEGNMPLFLPCPCGKVVAQLMRVHIVTPKAPVYVTIDPKVRPSPAPCPTFVTGERKPIPLSQSAYWVLRLPYVYASERKIYSVPSRLKNLKYGELLGPMFGITHSLD